MVGTRKSLTLKTLLLSGGQVISSLSSVLISVVLARTLTIDDFAFYKKAVLVFAVVSPLFGLGIPEALFFFLSRDPKNARRTLVTNLYILFTAGLTFAIGLIFLAGELAAAKLGEPRLNEVWWLVGAYGLAMVPMISVEATLVCQERVTWMLRFQVVSRLLLTLSISGSALYWRDPVATLATLTLWAFFALSFALVLMWRATGPAEGGCKTTFKLIRLQLAYGIPVGLASMLGTISTQLDRIMVSGLCSSEEFAWYVLGAIELPVVGIVTTSINMVILPELTRFYQSGDYTSMVQLWRMAMTKAASILVPAMGGVLLFADEIVVLLFSEAYLSSAGPFRVYALLLPLRSAVYGGMLVAAGKTRWITASALGGLIVNLTLNAIFIRLYGPNGAAFATVCSMYIAGGIMIIVISRMLTVSFRQLFDLPYLAKVFSATLVSSFCIQMLWGVFGGTGILYLAAYGCVYCIIGLAGYAILGLPSVGELLRSVRRSR